MLKMSTLVTASLLCALPSQSTQEAQDINASQWLVPWNDSVSIARGENHNHNNHNHNHNNLYNHHNSCGVSACAPSHSMLS